MTVPPTRGPAVRELGLALPPQPMRLVRARRVLKRWRYVGVYGPDLMLCAAEVFVGPLATRFWAVASPAGELAWGRSLAGRGGVRFKHSSVSVVARDVTIDLALDTARAPGAVESVAGAGSGSRAYAWTRKCAGVPAHGTVTVGGRHHELTAEAVIDDSAGYHPRHTAWRWSAGVGRGTDGERVGWNLVEGINDAPHGSERTIWIDGRPSEPGPVRFGEDGRRIVSGEGGELRQEVWATLAHRTRLGLVRSDYRQPFGTFSGELPGGVRLAEGYGVTERHDAWW